MRCLFSLFLFISLNVWGAELQLPTLTSPVMDLAQVMSESDREDLSSLAYEIYTNKGPQITILTVPDMQGYPIEEYSIKVAEKWKLGTEKEDNGLLIIVAQAERQMRIEVGQGLEGDITDYETAQYTRRIFPEYFRRGDFHGGLRVFMEDVAKKFNIELNPANAYVRRAPSRTTKPISNFVVLIFFAIIIIGAIIRNRMLKGLFTGLGFSSMAFMLGLPVLLLVIAFIFGLFIGIAGINNTLGALASGSHYRGGGGGFGGGSSGGGWGGGGGGFSGGGSSGNW